MNEEGRGAPSDPRSPCGHRNRPNARFCDACGVKLPAACSRCRAINRGDANFCNNCGNDLREPSRPRAGPAPRAPADSAAPSTGVAASATSGPAASASPTSALPPEPLAAAHGTSGSGPGAAAVSSPAPAGSTVESPAPVTAAAGSEQVAPPFSESTAAGSSEPQRSVGAQGIEAFPLPRDAVDLEQAHEQIARYLHRRRRARVWIVAGAASAATAVGFIGATVLFGTLLPGIRSAGDRTGGTITAVSALGDRDPSRTQAATPGTNTTARAPEPLPLIESAAKPGAPSVASDRSGAVPAPPVAPSITAERAASPSVDSAAAARASGAQTQPAGPERTATTPLAQTTPQERAATAPPPAAGGPDRAATAPSSTPGPPERAATPPSANADTSGAGAAKDPQGGAPPSASADKPRPAIAAEPRSGGELRFLVPAEPPSYDAHREETFALIHPAAPHYNTLLRIDPSDRMGTRVVADLAESWVVSPDKRTYVLKLRRGVRFHDGSEMTSRDVRATYEKIMAPPPGVTSARKGEYLEIETVQTPEPYVVAFKLKWPSPSFIHSLASPWNWIYKADILERDIHWYEKNIMGTGPFVFVEHVKGSHWLARRNPDYWDRGKPYLDGYRALFVRDDAAQAFAIRAERAHIQFRGFSPQQRDDIVRALGPKITVQESPWNCNLIVAINHEKKPFDDRRVRRALSLALDRYQAASSLSKIAFVRDVAGLQVPSTPFATPPAELAKLAGYGHDIKKSRAEARRLLAAAGVDKGFSFVLKNRNIPMPYEYIGTWLVDQWRQVGIPVRQDIQESGLYFRDLRSGNFAVSTDFQCGYVVDPDLDLYKFQSRHRSDSNYSRYDDAVLDDLYVLQSRTVDPEQRRRAIRAFEKRLLDEEAHYILTLQWHRIVPHSARVRGWTITPSHYLNSQLDTVWLAD